MNGRERFLAACRREPLERPPLWVMRQAGRYLPEYRALKESHGFLGLVRTPELACEVTLQPIRRFGMDAAILFSDILVIAEAMGQPYRFRDTGGIAMEFALDSREKLERLEGGAVRERLAYVDAAIRLLRRELGSETALIGFAGAPWTLAAYMVEGGGSKDHARIKKLFFEERPLFDALLAKITAAVIEYFEMQIEAGVDALQIFDSWGGILAPRTFWYASARWMEEIVAAVRGRVPVIVFARGAHHWIDDLVRIRADVYGVDWTIPASRFFDHLGGGSSVQGNLEPAVLNTTPEIVRAETEWILADFGKRRGHIFNLGHGILPDARIECVEALVATVRGWKG